MNPSNPTDIRILVVDDDADIAYGTAHLLTRAGYTTAVASNGVMALQTMPAFRPHLVLSDRDMPEMDGIELCRRLKSDPAFVDVVVILISGTFTRSEEQSDGMDSGADSYIARPIANRELAARVAAFVRILHLNRALREKNAALEAAMSTVKLLSGLLPICASCKRIRDTAGDWAQVETYVREHSEATFSHGICPDCSERLYPNLQED